ncbi:hypothetical protein DSM104443_00281 [Usitatibacter rugosus]|uniref:Uncharacterized protein n=1 Tax=Usitatibacter rugosus TaxID=2732067 RepID=A0A6M4GRZ0_9PROT|nr:hypothetical protein [Usitatibacter rugosus]QJR09244.1 hypothetical protein DSM104443_00281 [Usitatibacter rugosus]
MMNFAKSHRAALFLVFCLGAAVHWFVSAVLLESYFNPFSILSSWPWSWVVATAGESALWALSFKDSIVALKIIFSLGFALNAMILVWAGWYYSAGRPRRLAMQ